MAPAMEAAAKRPGHRKSTVSSKGHSKTGSRSASTSKNYRGKKGSRRAALRSKPAGPPRQQTPSTDRYAEIQRALADKGYYKGDVTGQWNADSVDALRRFQADQNLTVDGKIGALSLIALGLGPNRDAMIGAVAKPNEQTPQGQQ